MRPTRLHALLLSSILAAAAAPAAAQVVISQAYGGGGNTGAPLRNDFVEIFNRGEQAVSLSGKSVQYASSTGSFNSVAALPAVTLQPGRYFLLSLAGGANGTDLPTPDASNTGVNLSGTAGKVALVDGTTALACGATGTTPAPCSAGQLALMLDLVGFGSTTLFEGSAAVPTLSNITAAIRAGSGCTDTNDNRADFTAAAPAPRNAASPPGACGGGGQPTNPAGTGSASPSALTNGASTRLTVSVIPGTNPASTGISVQADLTAIGGTANQALLDNGTQGDLVAGDLVFSWQGTVSGAAPGLVSLPVSITDSLPRTASTTISISIVTDLGIAEIQGTGVGSPLAQGTQVVTEGIVTALRANGYFIQSAAGDEDADPATAEGLFVFTNTAPPADAVVGNRVRVSGRVTQFSRTPHGYPLTQLANSSLQVLLTGQALPAAVTLDASVLSAASPPAALGRYQGMRVALPSAKVVGSTNGFGDFHVTLPGTTRPFREPGIAALDAVPLPPGNTIVRFDRNPERLRVESTGLAGGLPFYVDAGTTVDGMTGVMYYDRGDFTLLIGDSSGLVTSGGGTVRAVPVADPDGFRIGSYNIENLSGGANVPVARLGKLNEVFCQYLRTPDVVGLIEIASLETLQRLATSINTNEFGFCPNSPQYEAYLLSQSGSQRLGFLVSKTATAGGAPRVDVVSVAEEFAADPLVAPDGSTSGGVLFDRAPLRLEARINGSNGQSYPVTVLLNHTLSLLDVNSLDVRSDSWLTTGNRSRGKRLQQAVKLSQLVESIQVADPAKPLVLIGDYNAFDFSDGYVDVMGIIGGTPAPAADVLLWAGSAVTRPLLNLTTTLPQPVRYSYVFEGNTQTLDHALVNQAVLDTTDPTLFHARVNADFAIDNAADTGVPLRTSDHDPLVVEFIVPKFLDSDVGVDLQSLDGRTAFKANTLVPFTATVANTGPDRALDTELTLRISAVPAQVSPVLFEGWICSDPTADGADTVVFCGRDLPMAPGASEALPVAVRSIRDQAREFIRVDATVTSRSREQSAANDSDAIQVQVTGKISRLHGRGSP
jgi:predicted extracellular nuclease